MVAANLPLDASHYAPVLKAKGAELRALVTCSPTDMVPLLELLDPRGAAQSIAKAWPHDGHVAWLHPWYTTDLEEDEYYAAVDELFRDLRGQVEAVPVVLSGEEPDYLAVVRSIIAIDGRGAVIRLDVEEILDPTLNTVADIDYTLSGLGLSPDLVDLVVDGGLLQGASVLQTAMMRSALDALPHLGQWRSIVTTFSAFPASVGEVVPAGHVRALPRDDAAAFTALAPTVDRPVTFGDYAVGTPSHASVPYAPVPNIKYAEGNEWHIHRGLTKKDPSPQYRQIAADLTAAPYFSNACAGDQMILDVATGASGPGNATTHLHAAVSRHLHVVTTRLATLGAP